ncbi:MAG: hypothetical protein ACP5VP_11170 [Candidatus Limnocylindrales bacterium]
MTTRRRWAIGGLGVLVALALVGAAALLVHAAGLGAGPGSAATGGATAPADARALTIDNVTRSLHAYAGFRPLANFDHLRITIAPTGDEVDLEARPDLVLNQRTFLLQAGSDALVAAKAIVGSYPSVQRIGVTLDGTFTDASGASVVEPGVTLTLDSTTVEGWIEGATVAPGADTVICYSSGYTVNPALWQALGPSDLGCLTAPAQEAPPLPSAPEAPVRAPASPGPAVSPQP